MNWPPMNADDADKNNEVFIGVIGVIGGLNDSRADSHQDKRPNELPRLEHHNAQGVEQQPRPTDDQHDAQC